MPRVGSQHDECLAKALRLCLRMALVSRAIQSVRLTGELSAEISAFSGQRGVTGERTDGGSVPFILSKSEIPANATLMLIGRTPAYSAPILEVLRRGAPARNLTL